MSDGFHIKEILRIPGETHIYLSETEHKLFLNGQESLELMCARYAIALTNSIQITKEL